MTKNSFQEKLNYFLLFLRNIFCCVALYNEVTDSVPELHPFQFSLDQSIENGRTVLPPLMQSIPSVLHVPPGDSKLSRVGSHFAALYFSSY